MKNPVAAAALVALVVAAGVARAQDAGVDAGPAVTPADAALPGFAADPDAGVAAADVDAGPTPAVDAGPTPAVDAGQSIDVAASPVDAPGFFDDGELGSYLVWYGPEYALVAAAAVWGVLRIDRMVPVLPTVIGPSFDLDRPNLAVLDDPRAADEVARPFLREKIPTLAVVGGGAVAGLALVAVDLATRPDLRSAHALVLGTAEAGLFPLVATDVVKIFAGRMRPDFRDRYYAAACADDPLITPPAGIDCATAPAGLEVERADLIDGMRSFPSGHAATSTSMATFFSLWLGSRFVWGEGATPVSRPLGVLGMGAVGSLAAFTSGSRLADHRHHPEDVFVGAAVGSAIGAATYFMHFDLDGDAYVRSFRASPLVVDGGGGVAVAAAIP